MNSPFAQVAAERRDVYNARANEVLRLHRKVGPQTLMEVLGELVAPAFDAISKSHSGAAEEQVRLLDTLVDVAFRLTSLDLLGPQRRLESPTVLWRCFPEIGEGLIQDPELIRDLSNAAIGLGTTSDSLALNWVDALLSLNLQSPQTLRLAGQVLAWRLGVARWRESAIDAWRHLPDPLKTQVLDAPNSTDILKLEQHLKRPFVKPGEGRLELQVHHRVAGFSGFGGPFTEPPLVWASGPDVFVADSQREFRVIADYFGAELLRVRRQSKSGPSNTPGFDFDNGVIHRRADNMSRTFPGLAKATEVALGEHFVAVGLPHSHFVWIIA